MKRVWTILIAILSIAFLIGSIILLNANGHQNTNVTSTTYNPYEEGGTWYKGQLHCHSDQSDGDFSPEEVAARYSNLGFDFIALTDHDIITKVEGSAMLVLGQEYGQGSAESGIRHHMNYINVSHIPSASISDQDRIDFVTAQNGIVSLCHPTQLLRSYSPEDLVILSNYTSMEIYNANHDSYAISEWNNVLSQGRMVWGVATDDEHHSKQFGKAWVEVRMMGNLSTDNIVNAIVRGSFYATQGPMIDDISFDGDFFNINCPGADEITIYGPSGALLTVAGGEISYRINGNENYVRAEVSQNGTYAWSQPVFLRSNSVRLKTMDAQGIFCYYELWAMEKFEEIRVH